MQKLISACILAAFLLLFQATGYSQAEPRNQNNKTVITNEKEPISEADIKLDKAVASLQRSAEKIKVVIEDKADRIAKNSQPAIENFLIASSELIEKLATEIEKILDEKPVKKFSKN
ncbi:MAG: hypothetical protein ACK5NK_00315 [Niabella sp.]